MKWILSIQLLFLSFVLGNFALAEDIDVLITVEETECTDGIDNDADALIDFPNDPGCSSTLDNDETDPVFPQCSDGVDNDGDTLIDFPADPGCSSTSDDVEFNDPPSSGGGGSSGGSTRRSKTDVEFRGDAYPKSEVVILLDGDIVDIVLTEEDGSFRGEMDNLEPGEYVFSYYATDQFGARSETVSTAVEIVRGSFTVITNIDIPPTIAVDKVQVVPGDLLTVKGTAPLESDVRIELHSHEVLAADVETDDTGVYSHEFDTSTLAPGVHHASATVFTLSGETIQLEPLQFRAGEFTVENPQPGCRPQGDFNGDCRINLVDFSILLFWSIRDLNETMIEVEADHGNADGQMDLVDFSIMAFYWTG